MPETSIPPSPVEIVFVAANDQIPASPHDPAGRPWNEAPCECAQSSIKKMPSERQNAAIRSTSKAMWPPMWTRKAARGRCLAALASKSANEAQRSSRLQSTNATSAPAARAASGVAMNVFDGHSTVPPRTPANSSAAIAAPDQLDIATDGCATEAAQAASNCSTIGPCDQRFESSAESQSACRRARSRWSNPIANRPSSSAGL